MNYAMWVAAGGVGDRSSATIAVVRVVVVRGAGEHFCAGADITELNVRRDPDERSFSAVVAAAEAALAGVPKPTVAFISGDCIGGGCSLAIDCDLRVATTRCPVRDHPGQARHRVSEWGAGAGDAPARSRRDEASAVHRRAHRRWTRLDASDWSTRSSTSHGGEERLATLTGVLASRSLLTQAATKSMVVGDR